MGIWEDPFYHGTPNILIRRTTRNNFAGHLFLGCCNFTGYIYYVIFFWIGITIL